MWRDVGAVLGRVVDAMSTQLGEHVLAEYDHLLSAELYPARIGGELGVGHSLLELG